MKKLSSELELVLRRDKQLLGGTSQMVDDFSRALKFHCSSTESKLALEQERQIADVLSQFADTIDQRSDVVPLPFLIASNECAKLAATINKMADERSTFFQAIIDLVLPLAESVHSHLLPGIAIADACLSNEAPALETLASRMASLPPGIAQPLALRGEFRTMADAGLAAVQSIERKSEQSAESLLQCLSGAVDAYTLLHSECSSILQNSSRALEGARATMNFPPPASSRLQEIKTEVEDCLEDAFPLRTSVSSSSLVSIADLTTKEGSPSPPDASSSGSSGLPAGRRPVFVRKISSPIPRQPLQGLHRVSSEKAPSAPHDHAEPSKVGMAEAPKLRSNVFDAPAKVLGQRRKVLLGNFLTSEQIVVDTLSYLKSEFLGPFNDASSKVAQRMDVADRKSLTNLVFAQLSFHLMILEKCAAALDVWKETSSVGPLFRAFRISSEYVKYVRAIPPLLDALDKSRKKSNLLNSFCKKFEEGASKKNPRWSSMRTMIYDIPVALIAQYELLMQQSNTQTRPDDPSHETVLACYIEFTDLERDRQNLLLTYQRRQDLEKRLKTISGLPAEPSLVTDGRRFIKEGPVYALDFSASSIVDPLLKKKPVNLFLLSDMLIETNRPQRNVGTIKFKSAFIRSWSLVHARIERILAPPSQDAGDIFRFCVVLPPISEGCDPQRLLFSVSDGDQLQGWVKEFLTVERHWGRERVFGVPLSTLMRSSREVGNDIPAIMSITTSHIIAHGLTTQGIFRLSGAKRDVDRMMAAFDTNPSPSVISEADDIHCVAVALKTWLRELPEPLIPPLLVQQLVESMKRDPPQARVEKIKYSIGTLPELN